MRIRCLFHSAVVGLTAICCRSDATEIPVLVFAGQSNTVGHHTDVKRTGEDAVPAAWLLPQRRVLYAGAQTLSINWAPLTAPTETQVPAPAGGYGPELAAGKTISDAQGGRQYGVVKFAVSGTSLFEDWNPAGNPISNEADLYPAMVQRVNAALNALPEQQAGMTGKVAGFFWMQGESDAIEGRTGNEYEADLTKLIAKVRSDFGDPKLPFVFALVGDLPTFAPQSACEAIRQAQRNVKRKVPNTMLVDPRAFTKVQDQVHYDNRGELKLGIAFGQAYLKTRRLELREHATSDSVVERRNELEARQSSPAE